MSGARNSHRTRAGTERFEDEKRLLPMLIAGLVLIVVGMIAVMWFV